jgi:membrane protease YdiL (CAAX protease family)
MITSLFAFLSFVLIAPTVETSTMDQYFLLISYYGFPLRWLELKNSARSPGGVLRTPPHPTIIWKSLILDFMIYFLLAIVVAYAGAKVSNKIREWHKIR